MGQPAAKKGDMISAPGNLHFELVGGKPPATSLRHPFKGKLSGELSPDVNIMGEPAATMGSTALDPSHHPAPGNQFANPLIRHEGKITGGSGTVNIGGKPAARSGHAAMTCNEPAGPPIGKVEVPPGCTVFIGD